LSFVNLGKRFKLRPLSKKLIKKMKRSLLILGLFLLGVGQAFSQNYYYYSTTGTSAPFNWEEDGATASITTLIAAPANDVLSASQTIPFSWSFYGQTVSTYKASDNGYITFDATATKSLPNSVTLPDTNRLVAPRNAIFAFWTDLNLQAASSPIPPSVISWTYGTAPNRVHVIEWAYAAKTGTAVGNTNFVLFSIRLYEAGGFDVVHTDDNISLNNALIGVQNSDGTLADMVNGSPYLSAPNSTGTGSNATDLVYNFKYGVQPKNDAAVINPFVATNNTLYRRTVPTFVVGDNTISITGVISNHASVPMTSVTVNYNVDGGAVQTQKLSGLSIPNNGGTLAFSHNSQYTAANAGFHNIKIWLSGVNDSFSEVETYDTTTEQIFVINGGTNNLLIQPLLECSTGAWCGFCPNGHISMKNEQTNYPDVIGIDYHWDDLMATTTSIDISNTPSFNNGFPSIMVNRILFPSVAPYLAVANSSPNDNATLDQIVAQVSNNISSIPVSLDILTKSWNPATREISFTVTGKFADYAGGDIRLNAFIVEDSLRGPDIESIEQGATGAQEGWDQHNYYSSTESGNGVATSASDLWTEPQYMIGYVHNNVARQALTGDWGITLPGYDGTNQVITPNTTFSKTFTTTLPAQVNVDYSKTVKTPDATAFHSTFSGYGYNKPESIRLVAFISNYNANDPTYGEVLNACQQPLLGWSAGIATYNANVDKISLYPNPASNSANVEYTLAKATDLTIEVYNVMGQKVQTVLSGNQVAGKHNLTIDASNMSNGLYFVSFISNGAKTTKQLMIQK